MGRYDFIDDEEVKKKLEDRQKEVLSEKKKQEVKKGKKTEKKDKKGPQVYTDESGNIGGVIFPKKNKKRKASESFGVEEEEKTKQKKSNSRNPSKVKNGDLPVKLLHTEDTRVGHEDRPEPADTDSPDNEGEEREKSELDDEHKDSIWQ